LRFDSSKSLRSNASEHYNIASAATKVTSKEKVKKTKEGKEVKILQLCPQTTRQRVSKKDDEEYGFDFDWGDSEPAIMIKVGGKQEVVKQEPLETEKSSSSSSSKRSRKKAVWFG